MRLSIHSSILVVAMAGVLGGCADTATLKPAPSANIKSVPGPATAAVDAVSGVQVTVIPREWPGRAQIREAVTPLKVRVRNNSDNRVMIRYSEIKLVTPDGRVYSALPPYSIDATVSTPALTPGYTPVAPGFAGAGFSVSPLYSPLYPGYPVAGRPFFYDPMYYGTYGSYWRRIGLPTEAMLSLALPEGVLAAGGNVEGYLYFQEVDPDVPQVRFRMDVLKADGGNEMGTIEIPFLVS